MGDCAEAFKVDGFDDQLCLSQRHSCSFAYVAILVVPVLFVRTWDARIGAVLATILISTAVLCLLCAYLSSTKRSTH